MNFPVGSQNPGSQYWETQVGKGKSQESCKKLVMFSMCLLFFCPSILSKVIASCVRVFVILALPLKKPFLSRSSGYSRQWPQRTIRSRQFEWERIHICLQAMQAMHITRSKEQRLNHKSDSDKCKMSSWLFMDVVV